MTCPGGDVLSRRHGCVESIDKRAMAPTKALGVRVARVDVKVGTLLGAVVPRQLSHDEQQLLMGGWGGVGGGRERSITCRNLEAGLPQGLSDAARFERVQGVPVEGPFLVGELREGLGELSVRQRGQKIKGETPGIVGKAVCVCVFACACECVLVCVWVFVGACGCVSALSAWYMHARSPHHCGKSYCKSRRMPRTLR